MTPYEQLSKALELLESPDRFEDWLKSWPQDEPVGSAGICPLRHFLRVNGLSVGVGYSSLEYSEDTTDRTLGTRPLPHWAKQFVHSVDSLMYEWSQITPPIARDCLKHSRP